MTRFPAGWIRKARSLAPSDWCRLLEAWLRLQWVGLRRADAGDVAVRRSVEGRRPSEGPADDRTWEIIHRFHRLTRFASRLSPGDGPCLRRSLVLQRLLAGRGVRTRLRIGVRKPDGGLQAHAWLECGGVPVGEEADVHESFRILSKEGAAE